MFHGKKEQKNLAGRQRSYKVRNLLLIGKRIKREVNGGWVGAGEGGEKGGGGSV